ncbi:MAG: histidinol dehydrogenase [Candidatus Methanodesulfokora sp.]
MQKENNKIMPRTLKGKDAWRFVASLENRTMDIELFKEAVIQVIKAVRNNGDEAVREYMVKYYGVDIPTDEFMVSKEEIENAFARIGDAEKKAIEKEIEIFKIFHRRQKPQEIVESGSYGRIRLKWVPLGRIGVHVPEYPDSAYISTMISHVVPAMIAGVDEIAVFTPPLENGEVNPVLLATAKLLGVKEVYRIGGPIAVAVMAYGTQSIQAVDKIFGAGDNYFMAAKQIVAQDTRIDMPSGPSENLIIADESSNLDRVLLDLISQAEHLDSMTILLTDSEDFAYRVVEMLESSLLEAGNAVISDNMKNTFILIFDDINDIVEAVNVISPERVAIFTSNAASIASKINNAGAVFINTPSAFGDYGVGMNQQLPSSGFARSFGALTVLDFMKPLYEIELNNNGINDLKIFVEKMALLEGFPLHAKAIREF